MSYRTIASVAVAALIGIACISSEASARVYRGGGVRVGGVHHGAVYRGGAYRRGYAYRGAYVRRGYGYGAAAVGAAAVGAAVAAPYYYNRAQCGYYPYPPCY